MKNLYLTIILLFLSACESKHVNFLVINGDFTAKKIIVADYNLISGGELSEISWYKSPTKDGNWELIQGVKTKELVLLSSYKDNYIKCEISVKSASGDIHKESVISESCVTFNGNPNTEWFKNAGIGVMVHFLESVYIDKGDSLTTWDSVVDGFNVDTFAKGCADAGASYVMFALGQNSGHYCSPSTTYDRIVGDEGKGLCSKRDLPMDVITALDKYGIKFMFYLPGNPPINNKLVSDKFRYSFGSDKPTSQFTQAAWEDVIREWSIRYGDKIYGWWFDGMYYGGIIETRCDMTLDHNISTHTLAAKAGNHNSIVTYNYGVDKIQSNTPYNDYSAGEEGQIIQVPESRWVDEGIQWFLFTYLGKTWGGPGVRFTDTDLTNWAKMVYSKDGVICFDINVDKAGVINPDHIRQAKLVKNVFDKH